MYKKKSHERIKTTFPAQAACRQTSVWVVRKATQSAIYYIKHQTSKFLNSNTVTFQQLQHEIVYRILQLKQYQPHNFYHIIGLIGGRIFNR